MMCVCISVARLPSSPRVVLTHSCSQASCLAWGMVTQRAVDLSVPVGTLKWDWLNMRGGFSCGGLTLAQDHWRNSHTVGSYLLLLNFNAHPSNWMKTQAATSPSLPDTLRTVSEQWPSMLLVICKEHAVCYSPWWLVDPQEGLDDQRELILHDVQVTGHGCRRDTQRETQLLVIVSHTYTV